MTKFTRFTCFIRNIFKFEYSFDIGHLDFI
jgi:hypothetical protein